MANGRRWVGGGVALSKWEIVITDWGLDSYLDLKHQKVFTNAEYQNRIRPDVVLLREGIPSPHPQFTSSTFWGPAKQGSVVLPNAYKMKWRNIGSGGVQMRLPIMASAPRTYLCEAYVKVNVAYEQRKLARFKSHMNLIALGRCVVRGTL